MGRFDGVGRKRFRCGGEKRGVSILRMRGGTIRSHGEGDPGEGGKRTTQPVAYCPVGSTA